MTLEAAIRGDLSQTTVDAIVAHFGRLADGTTVPNIEREQEQARAAADAERDARTAEVERLQAAPVGTLAVYGHPNNGVRALKCTDGRFYVLREDGTANYPCLAGELTEVTA